MKPSPFSKVGQTTKMEEQQTPKSSPLQRISSPVQQPTKFQPFPDPPALQVTQKASSNVVAAPFTRIAQKPTITSGLAITDSDIEGLGSDLPASMTETTDKIIGMMTLNRFGELGTFVAAVQAQAENLSAEERKGLLGWFRSRFVDLRQQMIVRLETANKAFDEMKVNMTNNIAKQAKWIQDLELLYEENFKRYLRVSEEIEKGLGWESLMVTELSNWPPIDPADPHGPMKMQARLDAEARINRLRIKIDLFRRLKVIAENNGPKIRSQQETSRNVIMTLNDMIAQGIPLIKMEFATMLQALDSMRSLDVIDSGRTLANQSLQRSAESSKEASLRSAKALNGPMVSNETLDIIRTKMLESVTGIRKIQEDAQRQREADAKSMEETQRNYLNALQTQGAIK